MQAPILGIRRDLQPEIVQQLYILLTQARGVWPQRVNAGSAVWKCDFQFEPRPGFIIEHSHRAAMYLVGVSTIVLAVGLWRCERRRWLR